jgi:colicin import membrane protein
VRGGFATSIALHAAILGWALFTIQAQRELRVAEPEPIAVDLVNASELTKLRQGARNAKQLEAAPKEAPKSEPTKKEAPKPAPAAAASPPPEPPAPKEEPKKEEPPKQEAAATPPPPPAAVLPVPAPEEQKKLEELLKEQQAQAEEQKRVEEQRRQAEQKEAELKKKKEEDRKRKEAERQKKIAEDKQRKAAEAKKQFDAEKISALLNKIPDKGSPPPSASPNEPAKTKGPALGAPEGRDRQISASEIAILAQIIRSCVQSKWIVMGGGEGAQRTIVKLRLRFNPDGTLATAPVVMNPQGSPTFLAVSDSAIRAAEACQPYPLPSGKYEIWKDIVLNFDPQEMF